MGYRWYDANNVTPAFEFGLGLSYTTFQYSNLAVSTSSVNFTITNTGSRAGAAVPQLYLGFPASAGEPPKQLKGFQKVYLQPGQASRVSLPLNQRAFSIWDISSHSFQPVSGTFTAYVGASSRDIRLTGTVVNNP